MKLYVISISLITTILGSAYYHFLYEPTITEPVLVTAHDYIYKKKPKFDNTLSAQYSSTFDPLDYKATLEKRITLSPLPEQPIDIFSKVSSNDEDKLLQIISEVESGAKDLSELTILPNSLTKTKKLQNDSVSQQQNTPKQPSRVAKRNINNKNTMLQLASVRSFDQAKTECERIRTKYPNILNQYTCTSQIVTTSKNTYHRVIISGFNSNSEARKICKKLRKKKQNCMLVK